MKILVTGINGQLGYDVMKELERRKIDCIGADIEDFDITSQKQTEMYIRKFNPDAVIHCSAYTAVDKAEDDAGHCRSVNAEGTRNIAGVCKRLNAKMLYISTDYVFPGQGERFYEVDDETAPLGVYGLTKLEGERSVKELLQRYFVVRTSWVYGINGSNFIKTMLKLSESRDEVSVVADQIGSPTYTTDLASLLCDMIITDQYGTYHATNEGICSWAEFAEEVFKVAGRNTRVNHITTEEFPARAARPKNSRLSKKSLDEAGFNRLPKWKDAVKRYIDQLNNDIRK